MTLENKITEAQELIRRAPAPAAVMCSFGKDSMVLLHLIRETLPSSPLNCHAYPVPVIYHRHPWFQFKQEFANEVSRKWSLELHDYPPGACGIKCNAERLELVSRYPFGTSAMDLPINTEEPLPRRDFVCGLQWVLQPKLGRLEPFPWRSVYIGHKSADVDPFEGRVPLKSDTAMVGGVDLVFPLRHWSDQDVWDYIETNRVPYDKRRYQDRAELPDKWLNPDYLHACTNCIDPRDQAKEVLCPKTRTMVPNVGTRVLRIGEITPDYIEKEAAA